MKTLDELFMAADNEMYMQKELHHRNMKKDA